MKTIYITEAAEKAIQGSILLNDLPDDILTAILRKKTSLSNNPALPDVFDEEFIEKIVKKRFEETKEELKKIGVIDDVEETTPKTVLSHLIKICQDIERPYRPQLEQICFNYVTKLFDIPNDTLELLFSIVDKVDLNRESILLDPIDGDEGLEFADIIDAKSIKADVYKRRLLDALSMGGAMQLSHNIKSFAEDIYDINPKLLDLYRKILALNDYILFIKEDVGMCEDDKKQSGTVNITIGNDIKKTKIEAQGVIFPILLTETIHGFLQLFMSHGLPKELDRAKLIVGKADFLRMEPWDMRLGPSLWNIFTSNFEDVDTTLLPYVIKKISTLPNNKFNYLFKEVFAKTRKGKNLTAKLIYKAKETKNKLDDDNFLSPSKSKAIITDNIYAEEI